jgi:hypothetical protein
MEKERKWAEVEGGQKKVPYAAISEMATMPQNLTSCGYLWEFHELIIYTHF